MQERNFNLDLVKIIAMFGVIGLHTFCGYKNSTVASVLYESCVCAVPLFFMTSGMLMALKGTFSYKYCLRKVFNILKFVLTISFIYFLIMTIFTEKLDISHFYITFIMSFAQKGIFWHFWYFGAMIIVYLLTPFLLKQMQSPTKILLMTIILFTSCFLVFIANVEWGFEEYICQPLRLWNWLLYFYLGGILSLTLKKKNDSRICLSLLCFLIGCNVVFQHFMLFRISNRACEYFYSSLPVIFLSTSVFYIVLQLKIPLYIIKGIKIISPLFLPVYTLHRFLLRGFLQHVTGFAWIDPIIMFLGVSTFSIIISYCLMKHEYINKIFRL